VSPGDAAVMDAVRQGVKHVIFVIKDDAQDGPDHVDSHRTVALVAGAYVKQGALVSTQYNWEGLMGDRPYPTAPTGTDLSQDREELLKQYRECLK
jgi:hypothetical protein